MSRLRHLLSFVIILLVLVALAPSRAEAQNVCHQCEVTTYVLFLPNGSPLIFTISHCIPTPGNNLGLTTCEETPDGCQLGGFVCATSIA